MNQSSLDFITARWWRGDKTWETLLSPLHIEILCCTFNIIHNTCSMWIYSSITPYLHMLSLYVSFLNNKYYARIYLWKYMLLVYYATYFYMQSTQYESMDIVSRTMTVTNTVHGSNYFCSALLKYIYIYMLFVQMLLTCLAHKENMRT